VLLTTLIPALVELATATFDKLDYWRFFLVMEIGQTVCLTSSLLFSDIWVFYHISVPLRLFL